MLEISSDSIFLNITKKSPYGVVEYKRVLAIGTALIALSAEFPTLHRSLICYKNPFLCNPLFSITSTEF